MALWRIRCGDVPKKSVQSNHNSKQKQQARNTERNEKRKEKMSVAEFEFKKGYMYITTKSATIKPFTNN